jgi:hypothetical protein
MQPWAANDSKQWIEGGSGKSRLKQWLEADAWQAEIAWGKARGTDVVARRDGETWLIGAKECGSRPEMRVNYFIAMLGKVLQRMNLPDARYSIALPDMVQFRRLWERLPALARQRTDITALFVSADGRVDHVIPVKVPLAKGDNGTAKEAHRSLNPARSD